MHTRNPEHDPPTPRQGPAARPLRIVMLSNTYLPHVGGVARSVDAFTQTLRQRQHRVLVVCPRFENTPAHETDVFRLPAIQHFNGSDFSVRLPVPARLWKHVQTFNPDILHAHHPFLLGDTAVRLAAWLQRPLVFTHHTMYERYTHYVPGDSPAMKHFATRLATEYANLCDHVIAPSHSIRAILRQRGVGQPIAAIPTGIDPHRLAQGHGPAARQRLNIPPDARLVGHVGRLAPEKNLDFLARALAQLAANDPRVHCLIVGRGSSEPAIRDAFARRGIADRLHLAGQLTGAQLADAYHAMDVFAFASTTETQGMVLAEAMTAGLPVLALDAPGAREMVRDRINGRLLPTQDLDAFARALHELLDAEPERRRQLIHAARQTAAECTLDRCTDRLLSLYRNVIDRAPRPAPRDQNPWARTLRLLASEWHLWKNRREAAVDSLTQGTY